MLEMISNPTIFFFIVGLSLVAGSWIVSRLLDVPAHKQPEKHNDTYRPVESVTKSKRQQRYTR